MDIFGNPSFVELFPNVTHLQLIPGPNELESHNPWHYNPGDISTHLKQAHTKRAVHQTNVQSWPLLDECSGELSGMYVLGLDHTLSKLSVWSPITGPALPALCAVVKDTQPRYLCLSVGNVTEEIGSMLREQHSQCPRRVDLDINSSHIIDEMDMPAAYLNGGRPSELEMVQGALLALLPLPVGLEELRIHFTIPRRSTSATGTMRQLGHLRPQDNSQSWDYSGLWNYSDAFIPFQEENFGRGTVTGPPLRSFQCKCE